MKDQPWDLNQTWPVCRKWCRFTKAFTKKYGCHSPKFGAQKNITFLTTFLRDFCTRHGRDRISPERNVASTNKNAIIADLFIWRDPKLCVAFSSVVFPKEIVHLDLPPGHFERFVSGAESNVKGQGRWGARIEALAPRVWRVGEGVYPSRTSQEVWTCGGQ